MDAKAVTEFDKHIIATELVLRGYSPTHECHRDVLVFLQLSRVILLQGRYVPLKREFRMVTNLGPINITVADTEALYPKNQDSGSREWDLEALRNFVNQHTD